MPYIISRLQKGTQLNNKRVKIYSSHGRRFVVKFMLIVMTKML